MATLAGVSANITRLSIHKLYAKYANDGYLLLCASARGQRPKMTARPPLPGPRKPFCGCRVPSAARCGRGLAGAGAGGATRVIVCSYPRSAGNCTRSSGRPQVGIMCTMRNWAPRPRVGGGPVGPSVVPPLQVMRMRTSWGGRE